MTTTDLGMLYERLSGIGLSRRFIEEQALPDWWDKEFEETPGAAIEAAAYISRRLNLNFNSLLEIEAKPEFKKTCLPKFKAKAGSLPEYLVAAHCVAARIAEMVAYACKSEHKVLPDSAQLIRNVILKEKEREFVDFSGLLNFCWNLGLPTVFFNKFPQSSNIHKFDGMVAFFRKRPVIMISRSHKASAWLLFILAHELGHIVKGHVNESLIDEKIEPESFYPEEIEANEFAVELLLGKPDITYYKQCYFTGEQLAEYGRNISKRDKVDPGVVILNYAWNKAIRAKSHKDKGIIWATASKALKAIENNADATKQINRLVFEHIDIDRLDNDSQDYLKFALAE